MFRKRASKGVGRQGVVLKRRRRLPEEPTPCRPMPLLAQLRDSRAPSLRGGHANPLCVAPSSDG